MKQQNNLFKLKKSNKGITLVALVVTIIVLVILVGISINLLFGQYGIVTRAGEAKEEYTNAQKLENVTLVDYENKIDKYVYGTSDEVDEEDYKKLEDATRIFFNNNVFTLKDKTTVLGTGTTTTTNLNKLVATITIPTEIIDSGIISTGNTYLYLSASKSNIYLSPSSDGFMYIMYNNTKYILYENDKFISNKIQLVEGVNQFEVYIGWNNYHSDAYINLNLREKYTCYEGNMIEKSYGTGTMTQSNLDKTVATETIDIRAKYFTATVTNSNIYVDPLDDVFMYILYNGTKYYFYKNKEFKTVSIPIADGIDKYEVHMGWNNYHSSAYENIALSVIYRNSTDIKALNEYIHSLNKVLGYE